MAPHGRRPGEDHVVERQGGEGGRHVRRRPLPPRFRPDRRPTKWHPTIRSMSPGYALDGLIIARLPAARTSASGPRSDRAGSSRATICRQPPWADIQSRQRRRQQQAAGAMSTGCCSGRIRSDRHALAHAVRSGATRHVVELGLLARADTNPQPARGRTGLMNPDRASMARRRRSLRSAADTGDGSRDCARCFQGSRPDRRS